MEWRSDKVRSAWVWLLAAAIAAGLAGGCRPPSVTSSYEALAGTVEAVRSDTFELVVRLHPRAAERARASTVTCLCTKDTEIYLNDRFSAFDVLTVGDTLELIGYYEPNNPRGERFVVSFAYVVRQEAPPPEPVLLPASIPANQPREIQNG